MLMENELWTQSKTMHWVFFLAGCLEAAGVSGGRVMCGWLGRSSYFIDCISISLVASLFKHTNQVAVGGSRAKLLFPLLQCSSPGEERGHNIITMVVFSSNSIYMSWITVNGVVICVHTVHIAMNELQVTCTFVVNITI